MYTYVNETIYLLGKRGDYTFPLIKVVADSKGIKICGLSASHKGMYTHAERYSENIGGSLDSNYGHLHFRDTRASLNWEDVEYKKHGAKPGIRGGCRSIPPLDRLKGRLHLCGLGFTLCEAVMQQPVKSRYWKSHVITVDLSNYPKDHVKVDVILEGEGDLELKAIDLQDKPVYETLVYDKGHPRIIFDIAV